jgi:hypothetical protein
MKRKINYIAKLPYLLLTIAIVAPLILPTSTLAAGAKKVARVIILRGDVTTKGSKDSTTQKLERGMWLNEGATVKTAARSFAKLLFLDKSQINVGPRSQMVISKFPKKKAGIITLLKGELRAKVSKNYMQIKDKEKSKLFIKTKSAALGVRGTDFQVLYNVRNRITSLVTFEGRVAMAKISEAMNRRQLQNQNALEKLVSSKTAVIVKRGEFSGASPHQKRVTIPVKISPAQLETLKSSEKIYNSPTSSNSVKPEGPNKRGKKKKDRRIATRNPIPPGMSTKIFVNSGSNELEKELKERVGAPRAEGIVQVVKQEKMELQHQAPPPEGFVDHKSGAIAPPAGGYIDLKTAMYVPPPPGSTFDPNTNVYVPPKTFGTFDRVSGDYVPPEGFELKASGEFAIKVETPPGGYQSHDPNAPPPAGHQPGMNDPALMADGSRPGPESDGMPPGPNGEPGKFTGTEMGPGPDGYYPPAPGGEYMPPPPTMAFNLADSRLDAGGETFNPDRYDISINHSTNQMMPEGINPYLPHNPYGPTGDGRAPASLQYDEYGNPMPPPPGEEGYYPMDDGGYYNPEGDPNLAHMTPEELERYKTELDRQHDDMNRDIENKETTTQQQERTRVNFTISD